MWSHVDDDDSIFAGNVCFFVSENRAERFGGYRNDSLQTLAKAVSGFLLAHSSSGLKTRRETRRSQRLVWPETR